VTTSVECSIETMAPTTNPTVDPTVDPTTDPTSVPTPAPTYDDPGVYMRGSRICTLPRCECFQEQRTCCTPFGAEYGPSLTGGFEPGGGCSHSFYSIEVPATSTDLYEESITLEMYPEGFTLETEVVYTVTNYGVFNATEFESLSWLNDTARRRRLQNGSATTASPGDNELNIFMSPPGASASWTGSVSVADGTNQASIALNVSTESITCSDGEECVSYEECISSAVGFAVQLNNCSVVPSGSGYGECSPLYPETVWVSVTRSAELCAIIYGMNDNEETLPGWFWWVLIALLVFMVILGWLIYRFWWKQKKTASELGDAEDEHEQQIADNEAGLGRDLDVGDVAFNPMATGVPGMDRNTDVFGNELQQRQLAAHNDMVDVQAEVFQVRQDYGQVATAPRGNF